MLKNKLNYFLIHNYEILLLILVIIYFYYQKIPTSVNNGWLGGFDQSKLLESSLAFKDFDLSSDKHHYPIFYSLIASPFFLLTDYHGFLFLDLILISISYTLFKLILNNYALINIQIFLIYCISFIPNTIGSNLISPNTIKVSLLIFYTLIYIYYRFLNQNNLLNNHQLIILGISTSIIIVNRPFDLVAFSPLYLIFFFSNIRFFLKFKTIFYVLFSFLIFLIPFLFLYLEIHNYEFNSYLKGTKEIGFNFFGDLLKKYNIFFNSYIYLDKTNDSLLNHNFWTYLFLPSIYIIYKKKDKFLLNISLLILIFFYVYSTYNDMLPNNFIKFGTIRYIIWAFPFMFVIIFFSIKYIFESKKHFKNSIYKFSLVLFIQIFVIFSPHVSFSKISKEKIIIKENDEKITLIYKPKKRFNSSVIQVVHKNSISKNINMFYGYQLDNQIEIFVNDNLLKRFVDYRAILLDNKIKIILLKDLLKFNELKINLPKILFHNLKNTKYELLIGKIDLL